MNGLYIQSTNNVIGSYVRMCKKVVIVCISSCACMGGYVDIAINEFML